MSRRNSHDGRNGSRRVSGRFIAFPHAVVMSDAFRDLSHAAKALLIEIAVQYMGSNNGQLLASQSKLMPRGWKSADTLHRAKRELLEAGFIFETVKGGRPNKASWYAVTWWRLNSHPKFDFGVELEYRRTAAAPHSGTSLTPPDGIVGSRTAPVRRGPAPPAGAVRPGEVGAPAPGGGKHLETPSLGGPTGGEREGSWRVVRA